MLRCALVLTLLLGSLPTLALAEEVTDEGRKAFKRCSSCHAISGENGGVSDRAWMMCTANLSGGWTDTDIRSKCSRRGKPG